MLILHVVWAKALQLPTTFQSFGNDLAGIAMKHYPWPRTVPDAPA